MKIETAEERGKRFARESGYTEEKDSGPKPAKRKRGGKIDGDKAKDRPDRRARGGATKEKGKPAVKINIAAGGAGGGDPQREQMAAKQGMAKGVQIGARAAMQHMAGAGGPPPGGAPGGPPPGAGGPPPGGPPPGGGEMPPDGPPGAGMMRRGGGMAKRAKGGALNLSRKRDEDADADNDSNVPSTEDHGREDNQYRADEKTRVSGENERKRGGSVRRK